MKVRILVLEDFSDARETITKLIEFLEEKVKYTHIAIDFVGSIAAFKQSFPLKEYTGVILDDEVWDGNAFKQGLPEWARNKNSRVGIGLNSSDNHEDLAKKIGGFDLAKNPVAIKSFLMRLKNEI